MALGKNTLDELRIDRSAREPRRVSLWLPVSVLALIVLAVAGWRWFSRPEAPRVRTFAVRTASSSGGQRTLLNASGYVVARREATVSSKVTGKVLEILVEEGMQVEEGQILARLDASNLKASLELAEAQRASAKAALDEIKVRLQEAGSELQRISGLATNQVASVAELDRASAEYHSLQARLLRQETEVLVAERQVAIWQQQIDDTLIRAPFGGVVVSKNAQPGEMISPVSAGGGFTRTGICTIVDMDSLEIEVDVNESYINRVRPGQEVDATLDAYQDWKIPAKVLAIIPTADRQKATVKVRVSFDKLDSRILPQMGVKVAFQSREQTPAASTALLIPRAAVRDQDGRNIVFVLQNGHAERRAVNMQGASGEEVAVLAGLAAGERVIISGPANLKAGDRVQEETNERNADESR